MDKGDLVGDTGFS